MIRRVPALLCLVPFACLDPATPASAGPLSDSVPHITAVGQASAEVVPDQADIRLGIGNERPTAEAAASATAAQASAVVDAIKAQGIAAGDITSNFSLAAQYDSAVDPQTHVTRRIPRGYAAETRITVRLHDVSKAGALARLLIDKGANSFQGIDYSYAEEKALRRRLRGEAAKDAEAEARARTEALGLTLGRVLLISGETSDGAADLPVRRAVAMPAPRAAIPTEPGRETISESTTVIFEIEGKAR